MSESEATVGHAVGKRGNFVNLGLCKAPDAPPHLEFRRGRATLIRLVKNGAVTPPSWTNAIRVCQLGHLRFTRECELRAGS